MRRSKKLLWRYCRCAQREEITKDMVEQYINDVEKIVGKIQGLARQKELD